MNEDKAIRTDVTVVEQVSEDRILAFLRQFSENGTRLVPEVNLDAPVGYGYPEVEEFFDLPSSDARNLLEDLAGQNILDRSLSDRIHLCPECQWYTLNFQEVCSSCGSVDIEIQEVVHHFACAYVGAWSEFREGSELICPKCNDVLRNIGMDYEKPSDTYVCNECDHVFTESRVQARCLQDGSVTATDDLRLISIYKYRANELTARAIEQERLFGLDVQSILYDGKTRTVRRDYFVLELNREICRARRYGTALSLVLFWFDGIELLSSSSGTDTDQLQKELLDAVVEGLRTLDLVSSLEKGLGVLLLPETTMEGAEVAAERVKAKMEGHPLLHRSDQLTITSVVGTVEEEVEEVDAETVLESLHDGLLRTVRDRPGELVSIDWKGETDEN